MDDNKIIELYFQRDESAVAQTRERYGGRLQALAFRILDSKEDAEECENDTYLKAWNAVPPHRPLHLFAFLARICRNTALHRVEKSQTQKRSAVVVELSDELAQCLPDRKGQEELEQRELGELISTFLRGLSKEHRVLFVRRYFFGESIAELAAALSVSESKVKSSLFRTRNKLKDYLSKEELL